MYVHTHIHTYTRPQPILRKHIEIQKDPKTAAAEAQKRAAAPPGPPKVSEKAVEIG